jgi:hypothetical protein
VKRGCIFLQSVWNISGAKQKSLMFNGYRVCFKGVERPGLETGVSIGEVKDEVFYIHSLLRLQSIVVN